MRAPAPPPGTGRGLIAVTPAGLPPPGDSGSLRAGNANLFASGETAGPLAANDSSGLFASGEAAIFDSGEGQIAAPAVEQALAPADVALARWIVQYGLLPVDVVAPALEASIRTAAPFGSPLVHHLVTEGLVDALEIGHVVARARRAVVACGLCNASFSAPGATVGNLPSCMTCGGVLQIQREAGEAEHIGTPRMFLAPVDQSASSDDWPWKLDLAPSPEGDGEPAPRMEESDDELSLEDDDDEQSLHDDPILGMQLPTVGLRSARAAGKEPIQRRGVRGVDHDEETMVEGDDFAANVLETHQTAQEGVPLAPIAPAGEAAPYDWGKWRANLEAQQEGAGEATWQDAPLDLSPLQDDADQEEIEADLEVPDDLDEPAAAADGDDASPSEAGPAAPVARAPVAPARAAPKPAAKTEADDNIHAYQVVADLKSRLPYGLFKARNLGSGRLVTIRVLPHMGALGDELLAAVQARAKACTLFQDPHVSRVVDVGRYRDRPWIASDHVAGRSLRRWVKEEKRRPKACARIVRYLASGLENARRGRLAHGAVAFSKVRVRKEDDHPVLTGFDVGAYRDWLQAAARGGVKAIEMLQKTGQAVPADDVVGLGAILHELLHGRPPGKDGETAPRGDLDSDLDAILRASLHPDERSRYPTPGKLSTDLQLWLAGQPIAARGGRWRQPRPVFRFLAQVAAVSLVCLLVASPWLWKQWRRAVVADLVSSAEHLELAGELDAAILKLGEAIEADPESAEPRTMRARLYMEQRRFRSALEDLDAAIAATPGQAGLHLDRARCRRALDRPAGVLEDLDVVLDLEPTHKIARAIRAVIREVQGDAAGARADLEDLVIDAPTPRLRLRRGLLLAAEDPGKARVEIDAAIEIGDEGLTPETEEEGQLPGVSVGAALFARARLRENAGEPTAAVVADLREALGRDDPGLEHDRLRARRQLATVALTELGLSGAEDPERRPAAPSERDAAALERATRLAAALADLEAALELSGMLAAGSTGDPAAAAGPTASGATPLSHAALQQISADRLRRALIFLELATTLERAPGASAAFAGEGDGATPDPRTLVGRALGEVEAVLASAPLEPLANGLRGIALAALDADGAAGALEVALRGRDRASAGLGPRDLEAAWARVALARCRLAAPNEDPGLLARWARQAVAGDPDLADGWLALGTVEASRAEIDEAQRAFDEAVRRAEAPPRWDTVVVRPLGEVRLAVARAWRAAGDRLGDSAVASGPGEEPIATQLRRRAIAALAEAARGDRPDRWELKIEAIELKLSVGDLDEARFDVKDALGAGQDKETRARLLCLAAELSESVSEADAHLEKAKWLAPEHPRVRFVLARYAFRRLGDHPRDGIGSARRRPIADECREHLEAALAKAPGDRDAWRLRVVLESRLGNHVEVLGQAETAAAKHGLGDDPVILRCLSHALAATGKMREAVALQERTERLDRTEGFRAQAMIFAVSRRWLATANCLAQPATQADAETELLALRAGAWLASGRLAEAAADLEAWSERHPVNPEPIVLLGTVLTRRKDAAGLDRLADRLERLERGSPDARRLRNAAKEIRRKKAGR